MKKNNIDFDSFPFDKKIKSLPNVPVSQSTKDRILINVLQSKNRARKNRFKNVIEVLSPITVASAMIIMLLFFTTTYNIGPNSYYDGFYLILEGNVEGANIFLDEEELGHTPMTDKIKDSGKLRITKEGYEDWTGVFVGKSLSGFLRSFNSADKYQLYRGNNTVKISVELTPINNDTIVFYTDDPGATILVNGRYAGLTPSPITLAANYNVIEVIQPRKEKITFELFFDGNISLKEENDKMLELTDKGYILRLESEELYHPVRGNWINEREYLVLEYDGSNHRGRVINRISGKVTMVGFDEINHLLNLENQKTDLDGLLKTVPDARIVRIDADNVYYQSGQNLYSIDVSTNLTNIITTNLDGEVGYVEATEEAIYFTLDERLYGIENGDTIAIAEDVDGVVHFTIKNNEIFIFHLNQYVEIWHGDLEKESIRKIY